MFLTVDLKLSTFLVFCFVFVFFWTHVLCFTCNIEIWQSLSWGWAWLSDCFSRLSPNLCCLFQALSIEMCFTAEYLQRKHDLTWHHDTRHLLQHMEFSNSGGNVISRNFEWTNQNDGATVILSIFSFRRSAPLFCEVIWHFFCEEVFFGINTLLNRRLIKKTFQFPCYWALIELLIDTFLHFWWHHLVILWKCRAANYGPAEDATVREKSACAHYNFQCYLHLSSMGGKCNLGHSDQSSCILRSSFN